MKFGKILKNIGIVMLGTGSTQLINFVFGIILVRFLTNIDYAVYKQGTIILNLSMAFFFLISPISISYFISKAKSKVEEKSIVFNTVLSLMLFSLLGGILLFVFRDTIAHFYNNARLGVFMGHFAIIIFFETVSSCYTYYLVAVNKNKKMAITTCVFATIRLISLVISMILPGNEFNTFIYLYILSILIKFIYIVYDIYRDYKGLEYKLDKDLLKRQVMFSIPLISFTIINVLNVNLDKNLVAYFYDPATFAIYVNGAFEIPFTSVITTSIITIMLPEISRMFEPDNKEKLTEIVNSFKKLTKMIMVILIPIAFAIMAFSDSIVVLLFSEKYFSCLNLFRIYLMMLVLRSFNMSVLLTAADKQKYVVRAGLYMIAANAIIIYIVYQVLGFNYMTLAPVLATLIMNILIMKYAQKIYQQKSILNFFPIKEFILIMGACGGMSIVTMLIREYFGITSITSTIIFGPIVFAIMLLISFFLVKDCKDFILAKIKERRIVSNE